MKKKYFLLTIIFLSISLSAFAEGGFSWRRKGNGCVSKNSQITLYNGQQIMIEAIARPIELLNTSNEKVVVFNTSSGPESKLYKITLESGKSVEATKDHPFIASNGQFIMSSEISIGTILKTIDGDESVKSVRLIEYNDNVYNLYLANQNVMPIDLSEMEDLVFTKASKRLDPFLGLTSNAHTFYVNGVASGDLLIQNSLSK